jgi:Predicted membrane protein
MSGGEFLLTLVAVALGPVAWALWLVGARSAQGLRRGAGLHVIAAAVTVSALLLVGVLKTVASFDVVDDIRYQFMYLVLGLAWLRFAAVAFAFVGVSARDDAIERGNSAAAIALAGALVGAALCYVGGNIGDGPGWWVVVFSAVLSTLTSLVFWIVLSLCSPVIDAVVIDRDRATGARLAGFLIAIGLVLGRGVAGDWTSATQTIADFAVVLPLAGVILMMAIGMERLAHLTPERPQGPMITFGILPALAYLAVAVTGVRVLGWPP